MDKTFTLVEASLHYGFRTYPIAGVLVRKSVKLSEITQPFLQGLRDAASAASGGFNLPFPTYDHNPAWAMVAHDGTEFAGKENIFIQGNGYSFLYEAE